MNFLKSEKGTRKAAYAGQFYPKSGSELTSQLKQLFQEAREEMNTENQLQAIISPHAGYIFSGKVAASAYNQIPENSNYRRIFVLASSHGYYFKGAAVYTNGNYETPLGDIEVDINLCKQLSENSELFLNKPEAHENEHSLEVQLPFLQHMLGSNFLLVPIILGTNSPEDCEKIAEFLERWFTSENLFVISTDFSHYPNYKDAKEVDLKTANAICSNQPENLLDVLKEIKKLGVDNQLTSLCGWTSVLTLLHLTQGKDFTYEKIDYQNSGDSLPYGDRQKVVGYYALSVKNISKQFILTDSERTELLVKARNSIGKYLDTGKRSKSVPSLKNGILNEVAGAFVSIYVKKELRGCIGAFAGEKTLNDVVQRMAVSAARDGRFENIKLYELEDMELEISVLSPLKKISSKNEIELGKHGIYIKQGLNSGTFLPQVATKTGWTVNEFLGKCSKEKAGIGWEGWKTAELYTYEAIIFKG